MKKWLLTVLVFMIPVFIFGENYASLWKKVREAEKKDLPRVEYEQLQKIVSKAQKGRDYGQLLKAQTLSVRRYLGLNSVMIIRPMSYSARSMRRCCIVSLHAILP